MRTWLGGAALVAACALLSLLPTPAAAAPPCSGEAACRRACDTHGGAACRELGRLHAGGVGVAPDRRAAAEAWATGCGGAKGKPRDARSCRDLAALLHDGWTLEVPADPGRAAAHLRDALDLAGGACGRGDADGCLTFALAARDDLERRGWPATGAERATELVASARAACDGGLRDACLFLRRELWALSNQNLIEHDAQQAARTAADKGLAAQCRAGDGLACAEGGGGVLRDEKQRKAVLDRLARACTGGSGADCLIRAIILAETVSSPDPADPVVKEVLALVTQHCQTTANPICPDVGASMLDPDGELAQLGAGDAGKGLAILRFQCAQGDAEACETAGAVLRDGARVPKDVAAARTLLDRSCMLTPPTTPWAGYRPCEVCAELPDLPECRRRDTWQLSVQCLAGSLGACEELGDRYRAGDGVAASAGDAARSYKYACDASIKGACGKLDEVCRGTSTIGREVCAPSLLHTDVFYEAEWQLRVNRQATLSQGAGGGADAPGVTIAGAPAAAGGATVARGSLDADLVVSVVLDRARQAAIRLVVDELRGKLRQRGLRSYVRDLLAQGAGLLADTTSLRRDALHDLGMTLVRAFAASNLVRTLFGDADALRRAPGIGELFASWEPRWLAGKDGRLAPELEAYLADLAYWALGAEPLFARAGAADADPPACPFRDGRKALCDALGSRAAVAATLRLDGVLTALNMIRALHADSGIDVRRLVEAIAQSTTIVDFASTPGLNIDAWQSRIIDELRARIAALRGGLADLVRLTDPATYQADGPDLATLTRQAASLRAFLAGADARALLDRGLAGELTAVLALDRHAPAQGLGGAAGGTAEQLDAARREGLAAANRLGASWRAALRARLQPIHAKLDALGAKLDELGRHVVAIRASLEHHQRGNGGARLAIDDMPLGDLDELLVVFGDVLAALDVLDRTARELFPSIDLRGLRFARSSCVRLLGFLDLMSRVARTVRLTQSVREVLDTLALLGRWKDGEFSAPLFDMLQPVLAVIETRKPMPLEQLFAIVGRVRLDSLVTSLLADRPCADEDQAECWVFKIAYSLQEAIARDGDAIRIDGAEVAKRLARFGDDFRRRERGRWYFHLTVGVGTVWSAPAGMPAADPRFAPLISEQVGFGWATPSMWRDRLTLKVGLAASGILYRALLDHEESDAVMGSAFVAVDLYDLVELYGAATVLAYPPLDGQGARVAPGVTFGLSVPLSAYLERL